LTSSFDGLLFAVGSGVSATSVLFNSGATGGISGSS
jgi:hypothetical protein